MSALQQTDGEEGKVVRGNLGDGKILMSLEKWTCEERGVWVLDMLIGRPGGLPV